MLFFYQKYSIFMAREEQNGPDGLKMGQIMVVILLLSIAVVAFMKFYPEMGGKASIPREMRIQYMPADFQFDVDEDYALAVLTNPKRYRQEFNELIKKLNLSILMHVANRMGLSPAQKGSIPDAYERQHAYLRDLYYQDFIQLQDSSSALYQSWYDNQFKSATDLLFEIASKYTCTLVNAIIAPLVPMKDGTLYGTGKNVDTPCGIALSEALAPFLKKLQVRAAIQDFGRAEGLFQERVEKVIAELATYEVRDKKGLSKQMKTKVLGLSVSSTEVEITAISIAKIGFRLDTYSKVQLDPRTKVVSITLPEPRILSHEVYPRFEKLDIGWMREVNSGDFNRAINLLREEFRRDIATSDAYDKSKAQARELLETMFGPLVQSFGKGFQLRVAFQPDERFETPGPTPD
jgi:hypothetical protein